MNKDGNFIEGVPDGDFYHSSGGSNFRVYVEIIAMLAVIFGAAVLLA